MGGEVIKSFLVSLGFEVDDSTLKKFNKAISDATIKIAALYAAVNVTTGLIFRSISGISEEFEQMGYEYRLIAPAINKTLILRQEMLKAYSAAGVNITKVIQQSVKFNFSLTKTQYAFKALYSSVAARFFPLLTKQLDLFRNKLYANMPKIQAGLERFIKFIFKAFEAVSILGARIWSILTRVYDFFSKLHDKTDGWSTVIFSLIAAWKFLNLAFLATPLGLLLTGFTALLALWDDFKTFQEGGQSLINWGSDLTKTIVGLIAIAGTAATVFYAGAAALTAYGVVAETVTGIMSLLDGTLTITELLVAALSAPVWLVVAAITALVAALVAADAKWKIFGGTASGFVGGIGDKVMGFLGGAAGKNLTGAAGLGTTQPSAALGAGPSNNSTSNKVNQQTSITVMGSADAAATGAAVASQQTNVNRDMVRNLSPVSR